MNEEEDLQKTQSLEIAGHFGCKICAKDTEEYRHASSEAQLENRIPSEKLASYRLAASIQERAAILVQAPFERLPSKTSLNLQGSRGSQQTPAACLKEVVPQACFCPKYQAGNTDHDGKTVDIIFWARVGSLKRIRLPEWRPLRRWACIPNWLLPSRSKAGCRFLKHPRYAQHEHVTNQSFSKPAWTICCAFAKCAILKHLSFYKMEQRSCPLLKLSSAKLPLCKSRSEDT